MSNGLERHATSNYLESLDEGSRDLAPTYSEEREIIKNRVLGQRFLDEQRQLAAKGVAVISDSRYEAKIAHRVSGDRTYSLLSDVEDEVQFRDDAEFYRKVDRGLDDTLLKLCKVTEDAVIGTLQSHRLPQDALLIRQEQERVPEEVVEKRKLTPWERVKGEAWVTYYR